MRDFRPADVLPVRQLIHGTIDAAYSGYYPPRAVAYFKLYHSEESILGRSREGEVLVIELDGEIVATGTLGGDEILGVFVDPAYQRRGYGETIVRELERRAKANSCTCCTLNVSLPSRGFYEGLGYQIGEDCSADMGEGQHLDYWVGTKLLAAQPI
jgi:GNAT superfamily N-acetyltransferase